MRTELSVSKSIVGDKVNVRPANCHGAAPELTGHERRWHRRGALKRDGRRSAIRSWKSSTTGKQCCASWRRRRTGRRATWTRGAGVAGRFHQKRRAGRLPGNKCERLVSDVKNRMVSPAASSPPRVPINESRKAQLCARVQPEASRRQFARPVPNTKSGLCLHSDCRHRGES